MVNFLFISICLSWLWHFFSDNYVLRPTKTLSNPRKDASRWSSDPIDQSVKAFVVKIKSKPKTFSWVSCSAAVVVKVLGMLLWLSDRVQASWIKRSRVRLPPDVTTKVLQKVSGLFEADGIILQLAFKKWSEEPLLDKKFLAIKL